MAFGTANVGTYFVDIVPNMDKFSGTMRSSTSGISSLLQNVLGTGLGVALGNAIGGAFDMFMGSLDAGINRLDTINSFQRVMTSLGEAPEAAAAAIDDMKAALDGLPTATNDMAAWVQQIRSAGEPLDRATDLGIAMNNALLAGGGSAADVSRAMDAYNTILARGVPDLMHWRSLVTTSPAAMDQLAKSLLGAEAGQMDLYEALQNGTVSMDEFNDAVIRLNEEGGDGFASFEEQARAATGGIGTALQNVKNRLANAWAIILDAIGAERISGLIDSISSHFKDLPTALAPFISDAADKFFEFVGYAQEAFGQFKTDILPYVQDFANGAMEAWQAFQEALQSDEIQGVMERLGEAISTIQEKLGPFYNDVLVPMGNELFPAIGTALAFLGGVAIDVFSIFLELLTEVMDTITWWKDTITNGVTEVQNTFQLFSDGVSELWGIIKGAFSDAAGAIGGFMDDIATRVSDGWQRAKDNATDKLNTLKSKVEEIFNGIKDFVKGIPDDIIGFFSGLGEKISNAIGSIHFPKPHVTWGSESKDGLSLPLPHVSWYGAGGIVSGAMLFGAGERGTELIWPSYSPYLEKYADAIASRMGGGGVYINATTVNDAAVIDVTRRYLGELQRLGAI